LVESVVDDQTDVGNDVTLQEGEPIVLSGDATALRRMIVNLVENALKYGERARLRLKRQAQDCTLEIDDDGPGIPDSQQQRVFQPVLPDESSRNRNIRRIGLGLATVRAIVLDHGGSIGLRNRAEGGLRVTVTIPAEATRELAAGGERPRGLLPPRRTARTASASSPLIHLAKLAMPLSLRTPSITTFRHAVAS